MKVTKIQVEQAIAKMDQTTERTINDGSGMTGTFQLNGSIADNITQWINDSDSDSDEDTYEWTESDIIDYIDETYPEAA